MPSLAHRMLSTCIACILSSMIPPPLVYGRLIYQKPLPPVVYSPVLYTSAVQHIPLLAHFIPVLCSRLSCTRALGLPVQQIIVLRLLSGSVVSIPLI